MNNENTYLTATGKIEYNMTNDYMFRIILQENKIVLKGLICSLLHYENESIKSVEVKNPIKLGDNISEKTYILDVNVLLNDDTILNLEMQMQDLNNWTERALCYTCRNFTHLQKGHDYSECQSVIHIGFLNYTLFPKHPEFYATYMLENIKNHHLFSSKIRISVVDLTQTELATDEDKSYGIDQWVALFKSKTWEELRMIANEKPELLEATKSLYEYNNEDTIRFQCYAREDYIKQMNSIRRDILEAASQNEKLTSLVAEKDACIKEKDACIKEKDACIKEKEDYIKEKEDYIKEIENYIKELETKLAK